MNGRKKNKFITKYLSFVCVIVGCFSIIGIGSTIAYSSLVHSSYQVSPDGPVLPDEDGVDEPENTETAAPTPSPTTDPRFVPPDRTNVMILGLDKSGLLSDVILLASYDAVNNKTDIISVPRDTYTKISSETKQQLKDLGRKYPSSGVMKLNELHSYAGKENGYKFSRQQLENIFDIKIDYYVEINTEAFRYIVDAVGGIYMDVRAKGYSYTDPTQNLVINVPGGYQLLDGKNAEGVVRFRHDYRNGDMDRIAIQQEFINQFFKQVLSRETVMNNIPALFTTLASYVKTDFGIDSLPKYLTAVQGLNGDSIEFHVTPGEFEDIYYGDTRVAYYKVNEAKAKAMMDEIYRNNAEPSESPRPSKTATPTPAK